MLAMDNYYIKLYSDDPDKHRPLIEDFRQKTFEEGSTSLTHKKYDCDDPNIETWMFFVEGKLASISAAERSHYTNDPDIAVRVCRYHILKPYRFSHAGLIMGEKQVQWARQKGFEILYITHDITNKAINRLYQRKRKMTVPTFHQHTSSEWYTKLTVEKEFLFRTGELLQYVYSIRLQDENFAWRPKSKYIVYQSHNGQIY